MKLLFPILLFFIITNLNSQTSANGNWSLSVDLGIQQHDKRLFKSAGRKHLLETQPEFIGTYQFGLSCLRFQKMNGKYSISYGLGLSTELSTFLRPYDQNYRIGFGNDAGRYTDRYYKVLLLSPIKLSYQKSDKISFLIQLLPELNIFSQPEVTEGKYSEKNYWFDVNIHSIELDPGIAFKLGRSKLEIKYRFFQIKKIDKLIFGHIIRDERTNFFETYNPFKIWITLST